MSACRSIVPDTTDSADTGGMGGVTEMPFYGGFKEDFFCLVPRFRPGASELIDDGIDEDCQNGDLVLPGAKETCNGLASSVQDEG